MDEAARVAWRAVVGLAVFLLLLSSCGSGDSDAANAPAGTPGDAPAQERAVTVDTRSPMERELGFASEPSRRQYQLINRQRAADATIISCMERAGFQYVTVPIEDIIRSGAFVGDGSRDWTAREGLGITSSFREVLEADTTSAGGDADAQNFVYVSSLNDAEATAYDQALVGDLTAPSGPGGYFPGGCWGEAFTEIVGVLRLVEEFEPELATLNSRIDADPRMIAFQQEWSTCMDATGHLYATESDLVDDIYARLLDIELLSVGGASQLGDTTALDALAAFEIEVALDAFDCRQGFADDLAELRFDYEQEFLADNRFRIADLQAETSPDE